MTHCQYCGHSVYDGICSVCEIPARRRKRKNGRKNGEEDGAELGICVFLALLATLFLT